MIGTISKHILLLKPSICIQIKTINIMELTVHVVPEYSIDYLDTMIQNILYSKCTYNIVHQMHLSGNYYIASTHIHSKVSIMCF